MQKVIRMSGLEVRNLTPDSSLIQELEYDLQSNFLSYLMIKSDMMDVRITWDAWNRCYDLVEVLVALDTEFTKPFEEKPPTFLDVVECLQQYEWAY